MAFQVYCDKCKTKISSPEFIKSGKLQCPKCGTDLSTPAVPGSIGSRTPESPQLIAEPSVPRAKPTCSHCNQQFPRQLINRSNPSLCPRCLKLQPSDSSQSASKDASLNKPTDLLSKSIQGKSSSHGARPSPPKEPTNPAVTNDQWGELLADLPLPKASMHGSYGQPLGNTEELSTEAFLASAAEKMDRDKRREAQANADEARARLFTLIGGATLVLICILSVGFAFVWFARGVNDWAVDVADDFRNKANQKGIASKNSNSNNANSPSVGSSKPTSPPKPKSQTKEFTLRGGDAIFTINPSPPHHLRFRANDGLVIDCDWKENPFSEFGYDIYEPDVNRTTNRLQVMLTARGIIASYLKGEYD